MFFGWLGSVLTTALPVEERSLTAVDVFIVSDLLSLFFEFKKLLGNYTCATRTCALCILTQTFCRAFFRDWKASLWLLTGFTGLLSAETRKLAIGNWQDW